MAWQDDAACVGQTDLFFAPEAETIPARRARESAAKAICATCPVVDPCRRAADDRDEIGIWGGMTERERYAERRRIILERRRRVASPDTPVCHARPEWRTIEERPNTVGAPIRLAIVGDGGTWHGFRWAVFRSGEIVYLAETETDAWLFFGSTVLT